VAEAFLAGGVANFLGTHWPVGDQAALAFSSVFYRELTGGAEIGRCMLAARQRVLALDSIDWADYVLYGTPDFGFPGSSPAGGGRSRQFPGIL
jgi:CHAT domain-containing protein